jgi:hypothetical protein
MAVLKTMATILELREAIANALALEKSYNLPGVCESFGLAPGDEQESFSSKRKYVRTRLIEKTDAFIVQIGLKVLKDHPTDELANILNSMRESGIIDGVDFQTQTNPGYENVGTTNNSISPGVRRNIFDVLRLEHIYFFGSIDPPDFLSDFFDLKSLPSTDLRYKDAYDDIWKHTVDNATDWSFDWLYADSRFDLENVKDAIFLSLLCKAVHPVTRPNITEAENIVCHLNEQLSFSGWKLVEANRLAGRPVYVPQSIKADIDGASHAPKVMISYVHESIDRREAVYLLSESLRSGAVDCNIDQYMEATPPPKGWPLWMEDSIEQSDFVLVVCSELYLRRFKKEESPGTGLGAQWEGGLITQEIYEQGGGNIKFIPILFDSNDQKFIPSILRSTTYYDLSKEDGYERLYRRLTGQPEIKASPLGVLKVLPPKECSKPEEPGSARKSSRPEFGQLWPRGA